MVPQHRGRVGPSLIRTHPLRPLSPAGASAGDEGREFAKVTGESPRRREFLVSDPALNNHEHVPGTIVPSNPEDGLDGQVGVHREGLLDEQVHGLVELAGLKGGKNGFWFWFWFRVRFRLRFCL